MQDARMGVTQDSYSQQSLKIDFLLLFRKTSLRISREMAQAVSMALSSFSSLAVEGIDPKRSQLDRPRSASIRSSVHGMDAEVKAAPIHAGRFLVQPECKSSSCHGGAGEKRSQYLTWSHKLPSHTELRYFNNSPVGANG